MNYAIFYHLAGRQRKGRLRGIPYQMVVVPGAELEDREFIKDFMKWLNGTGRHVVNVTVPTSCDTCGGWTASRQSVYSPKYKKRRGR